MMLNVDPAAVNIPTVERRASSPSSQQQRRASEDGEGVGLREGEVRRRVDIIVGQLNANARRSSETQAVHVGQRGKLLENHANLLRKIDKSNQYSTLPRASNQPATGSKQGGGFSYFSPHDKPRSSVKSADPPDEAVKSRSSSFTGQHKPPNQQKGYGGVLNALVFRPCTSPAQPATSVGRSNSEKVKQKPSLRINIVSDHDYDDDDDDDDDGCFSPQQWPSPPVIDEGGSELRAALDVALHGATGVALPGTATLQSGRKSSRSPARSRSFMHRMKRKDKNSENQNDPIDPTMFDPPKYNSTIDQDDEHDVDHKKKKEKKKKSKAPSRHGSDAKKEDRVRNKLKKFIGRRPTFESLKEQGIIKDSVFGCPLHNLCQKEQTTVPRFIKLCVAEVEKRGLDIDGIYRVSGNLSHVQKLRYLIDRDEAVDLSEPQWEDVHLITGALKMFLRELPEPVIPFKSFDPFIEACKIADGNERNQRMRTLVKEMPKENTDTLKFLMNHFRKVVEHSSRNRMQVQNVAIVFGPTLLLKPPDTSDPTAGGGGQMIFMVYQNEIIDTLLTQYSHIFL